MYDTSKENIKLEGELLQTYRQSSLFCPVLGSCPEEFLRY